MNPGYCYLVGAGPGDLGLCTLRAKELIEQADVLVYDYLSNPEMLRWTPEGCEQIYAGKKAGDHAIPQGGINQLLIDKAKEGKTVVRLKGGDPMVFGRGGEEAQELRAAGIPFEIVPGISSTIAGPCYAGIPVTHRAHNTQLTIFTGHEDPTKAESSIDYEQLAKAPGTKVMLMGVQRMKPITDSLIKAGAAPETPVAMVRWATTGQQQTLVGTLETIAQKIEDTGFKAPAVCTIGDVVGLREEINWFEERPLFGKSIVVTRTRKQAGDLNRKLALLGADAYEIPTIRIDPPKDMLAFGELVRDSHTYDWIVFTSPNAVDAFFDVFFKLYKDVRSIGGARIAAIGPGTEKKVNAARLTVDLLPDQPGVAENLVECLIRENGTIDHLKFLYVKAEETRDVINASLTKEGAIVDEAIAYRTVPETEDITGGQQRFKESGADVITFTSSSTVEHFLDLGFDIPETTKIASIGPITSATLRENQLPIDIEAQEHTIPGLIAAIEKHYAK